MRPLETASLLVEEPISKQSRRKCLFIAVVASIFCIVCGVAIFFFVPKISDDEPLSKPNMSFNSMNELPPNIILILFDDLGFTDTGQYSNYPNGDDYSFSTPNIERFASQGIKLNWHYSEPVCSPSRSALYVV